MKFFLLSLLPLLAAAGELRGNGEDERARQRRLTPFPGDGNQFIGRDDIQLAMRSPCPIINTLANHGFINRNGRNIQTSHLAGNLSEIYAVTTNFPFGPIATARTNGLLDYIAGPNGNGTLEVLNLARLHDHNVIEHDSSYVRQDHFFVGPEPDQDPRLVAQLINNCDGLGGSYNREQLKQRQIWRVMNSKMFNHEFDKVQTGGIGGAAAQSALLMALDQQTAQDSVRVATLFAFLGQETFPNGYHPQDNPPDTDSFDLTSDTTSAFYNAISVENRNYFRHFINKAVGITVSQENVLRFEGNIVTRTANSMKTAFLGAFGFGGPP